MKKPEGRGDPDSLSKDEMAILREKAETNAGIGENSPLGEMTPEDMRAKLHELYVHKIELQMQNDELRLTRIELEKANERYMDLYDMAPAGYCTISEKGIIIKINLTAADLLGEARGELINKPISRFICREDQDTYYLHRLKLCETGEPQYCELRMAKSDGTIFWAGLTATVYEETDGARLCRVIMQDITERIQKDAQLREIKDGLAADEFKRAKTEAALIQSKSQAVELLRKLKKRDEEKNIFLNTLSHELRNPLAVISMGLQLLDMSKDVSQTKKAIAIMKNQIGLLCRLVNDLLDLTRMTNNKVELKRKQTELNGLIEQIAADYRALFDKNEVGLDITQSESPVYLSLDPERIKQCIGNLLDNALKFSYKGSKVNVQLTREKDEVFIFVRDKGKGVAPEFIQELFVPFMQSKPKDGTISEGLGLGLSIVKEIAELHGGSVSAFSEGLGKGSLFTVRLPILTESDAVGDGNRCICGWGVKMQ